MFGIDDLHQLAAFRDRSGIIPFLVEDIDVELCILNRFLHQIFSFGKLPFGHAPFVRFRIELIQEIDRYFVSQDVEIELTSANFEAEVLKSDKPVLVDFWAPWCGPCKMLAPFVAEIATEKAGQIKVGKVNVDEAPDLAAKYGINSIPALFLFKDGKVAAQAVGFMQKADLERFVAQ